MGPEEATPRMWWVSGGWHRTRLVVSRAPGHASLSEPLAGGAKSCAWHQGPCQLPGSCLGTRKALPAWSIGLGPPNPIRYSDNRLPLRGRLHGKCSFCAFMSNISAHLSQPSLNPSVSLSLSPICTPIGARSPVSTSSQQGRVSESSD